MKKFLAGTAIAYLHSTNDELIGVALTTTDASIQLSVESSEIRAGRGNALQYTYYHSSSFTGSLTDAQFNLEFIQQNIGAEMQSTGVVYKQMKTSQEISALGNMQVNFEQELVGAFVWATINDKPYTFTVTKDGASIGAYNVNITQNELIGQKVCFRYAVNESGANVRTLVVSSDFVPNVLKIVLEAELFSSETGNKSSAGSKVGDVYITIPRAQLTGSQEITLSASGTSTTALDYAALAMEETSDVSCTVRGMYATITEVLSSVAWDEGMEEIAIDGNERTAVEGQRIATYGIIGGRAFIITPANRLKYFINGTEANGTNGIDQNGVFTSDASSIPANATLKVVKPADPVAGTPELYDEITLNP